MKKNEKLHKEMNKTEFLFVFFTFLFFIRSLIEYWTNDMDMETVTVDDDDCAHDIFLLISFFVFFFFNVYSIYQE